MPVVDRIEGAPEEADRFCHFSAKSGGRRCVAQAALLSGLLFAPAAALPTYLLRSSPWPCGRRGRRASRGARTASAAAAREQPTAHRPAAAVVPSPATTAPAAVLRLLPACRRGCAAPAR